MILFYSIPPVCIHFLCLCFIFVEPIETPICISPFLPFSHSYTSSSQVPPHVERGTNLFQLLFSSQTHFIWSHGFWVFLFFFNFHIVSKMEQKSLKRFLFMVADEFETPFAYCFRLMDLWIYHFLDLHRFHLVSLSSWLNWSKSLIAE